MSSKVNYIWVGKPRTVTTDKPQQDLVGPLKMYLAIKNPMTSIHFWCLEESVERYRSLLKHTTIVVNSIEQFLNEKLTHANVADSTAKVTLLINRVIEDHFQIRACVTAKESFAFYLMASEGGYVLDTNVLPASNEIEFPERLTFLMPAYNLPVQNRDNDADTDVGIMYSPPMNRVHAQHALNFFLQQVSAIDKRIPLHERYSESYKAALIHIVIQAALVSDSDHNQDEVNFWKAKRLGPKFPVLLDEQPCVIKYYANSHGADRGPRSALHDAAAIGDLPEVMRLLETGCQADGTISTRYNEKTTALFVAKFYGKTDVAEYLHQKKNPCSNNTARRSPYFVEQFSVGDILLKVDCRARKLDKTFNTQHHAMLIIAIDDKGYPTVAHMKFSDTKQQTGTLIIEPCPAAKTLILIHSPAFSFELRNQIAVIAQQACQHNQLNINALFLMDEYTKAHPYRGANRFEVEKCIRLLRNQPIQVTNVIANTGQLISCHDFVLSTIHMACNQLNEPIPYGFAIPPQLAWPDILNTTVHDDKALVLSNIVKIIPFSHSAHKKSNMLMLFSSPRNETSNQIQEKRIMPCVVM